MRIGVDKDRRMRLGGKGRWSETGFGEAHRLRGVLGVSFRLRAIAEGEG